ncbi:MAG: hypothetical protein QXS41_02780 [Candidatus Woesearchaeota archaeon]
MLWTEKYKPCNFDEFVGNKEIVEIAKKLNTNLPHILFLGPVGVGKKTLAKIIAKRFLNENFKENFLFVDLSYYSSIILFKSESDWSYSEKEIAEKYDLVSVKDFAFSMPINSPFRIVMLSGIENLDFLSQQALRVIIEKSSNYSRFFLIGKSKSNLISPIVSRMMELHFKALQFDEFTMIIESVLKKEKIVYDSKIIPLLYTKTRGNLSLALPILQSLSEYSLKELKKVFEDDEEISSLFELMRKDLPNELRKKIIRLIFYQAYEPRKVLLKLLSFIEHCDLEDDKKLKLIEKISDLEKGLYSYDEFISLESILFELSTYM